MKDEELTNKIVTILNDADIPYKRITEILEQNQTLQTENAELDELCKSLSERNNMLSILNADLKKGCNLQETRLAALEAGWTSTSDKKPDVLKVDAKLVDGSILKGCYSQSDGDYYWKGSGYEQFIDEHYVTHWMPSK